MNPHASDTPISEVKTEALAATQTARDPKAPFAAPVASDTGERLEAQATRDPGALTESQQLALGFWVKLARAHSAVSAHASADISRHGLTLTEFGILEVLYHRGPLLLGEVQRRILVSSGGITYLVDRLTAKGLVERRLCENDKRARYATLTAKGESLVAEIFPAHAATIERAVSGLAEEELRAASAMLRAVGLAAAARSLSGHDAIRNLFL